MADFLNTILGSVGPLAMNFIGGIADSKGGSTEKSASSAALEKLGFATERQTAMQMANKAADRGATRLKAKEEQAKEPSKMEQDVAYIYRQAFKDNKVAQATIAQLKRQGVIDRIPTPIQNRYADASTDPTLDPTKIVIS